MSNKNASLIHLKRALSSIDPPRQGIAATIGLLASSGLNHTQQMPEMCHLLQSLFDLTECGFFGADQEGNMSDAWCTAPSFLSFKTLMSCQAYQELGARTWPPFRENVLMGAVAGYLLPFQNERFYASPHFHATYGPMNVRHILDVVLHDGARPFGAFLFMRSAQQGSFTPDERRLLEQLIPILNLTFSTLAAPATQYAEKEMTGFALVGVNGECKCMSEEVRRIVWMLTHTQPGSFANPEDPAIERHLERLFAVYVERIQLGKNFSVDIDNRWGQFGLAFEQEPQTRDTILTLRRKVPLASQLAFCLTKLNLPPMRQMVAWLLAQNHTRDQIAQALGIALETVTSHIKLIYKATDTSSSHGFLRKLSS
jgi:hypothetical protein